MLTIVKKTIGNCMLLHLSFRLYSADLVIINSSLEVIASVKDVGSRRSG
jgi:hypothetical protein